MVVAFGPAITSGMAEDVDRRFLIAGAGAVALTTCAPIARAAGRTVPEFVGIDGWIISGPLSMRGLRGRPVLVNFWGGNASTAFTRCRH